MGKDNVPFHAVLFPGVLLGTETNWTLPYHLNSTEYLNYEKSKFSKSRGVGVFGDDAMSTGIPSDVWRYYLLANRPEQQDANFSWDDFQARNNHEQVANFGNLINRIMTLVHDHFAGAVPAIAVRWPDDNQLLDDLQRVVSSYEHSMDPL